MAETGHDFYLHLFGLLGKNYFQLFFTQKTTAGLRQTKGIIRFTNSPGRARHSVRTANCKYTRSAGRGLPAPPNSVCVNNNGSTNQSPRFRVEFMNNDWRQNFNASSVGIRSNIISI
jgi:hypothetical protein